MKIVELSRIDDIILFVEEQLHHDAWSQGAIDSVISFLQSKKDAFTYVVEEENDKITGVIGYEPESLRIVLLLVEAEHRRKKIGTELVRYVCAAAEGNNLAKIVCHASVSALAFYQSLGFEQCGEQIDADELSVLPMELLLGKQYLGKTVTVIVDHELGSIHPRFADEYWPVNFGYVQEKISMDDVDMQDAYVIGVSEPVESFTGIVLGMIYHKEDTKSRWIVGPIGYVVNREDIVQTLGFEEQYYDTRFIWMQEN